MTHKKSLSNKVDLSFLLSGSGLSDAVAVHLFGTAAQEVEVEILDAATGDDATAIRALHAAIERTLERSANVSGVSVFASRYHAMLAEIFGRLAHLADDAGADRRGSGH